MADNTPFVKVDKDPVTGERVETPINSPDDLPPEVRKSFMEAKSKMDAEQRARAVAAAKEVKQTIGPRREFKDLTKEEQELYTKEINSLSSKMAAPTEPLPANLPDHSELQEKLEATTVVKEEPKTCPCCGWDVAKDPVEVTEEDKANWLRSILGGGEFQKTFTLYGGKLKVTFRSRTMDDNNLVAEQLSLDSKSNKFLSDVPMISASLHQGRARRLSMACSFVGLSSSTFLAPTLNSENAKKIYGEKLSSNQNVTAAAHDVLFGKWPETLYSAVFSQYLKFESVCHRLMESSVSSDFWEGVEFST